MNPQDISHSFRISSTTSPSSDRARAHRVDPGRFRLVTIMSRRLERAERRILDSHKHRSTAESR